LNGLGLRRCGLVRHAIVTLLVLAAVSVAGAAGEARRYSGRVESVELTDGVVVVDELGSRGRPQRHQVHVGAETSIVSASRHPAWAMSSVNAYDEVPVSLVDVVAGDFVVVESVDEGGRAVARRITVVERPPSPAPRP
jgi:hypothetical protein